jgi:hypothetical protein
VLVPTEEAAELPLFHYARELLLQGGHEVVIGEPDVPLHDAGFAMGFGRACRRAADVDVGVWLSPDFSDPETATALTNAKGPGLVVGSLDDPGWDRAAAARLRQFELFHLNHVDRTLEIPGDVIGSIDAMRRVLDRTAATIGRMKL